MTVTTLKHVRYFPILAVVVLGAAINGSDVWSCKAQTTARAAQGNESNAEVARLISEGVAALERNDSGSATKLFQQAAFFKSRTMRRRTRISACSQTALEI